MSRDYPTNELDELAELRRRLTALEQSVSQIRRQREPALQFPLQVRWAITTDAYPTEWPTASANVFPIRFLDPHFTAAQGLQTFEQEPRSTDPVSYALSYRDWVPNDIPLPVFQQRGLGPDDAGEWWFLDPPQWYVGKLEDDLDRLGEAPFSIYLEDADGALFDSGCDIDVKESRLLPVGEIVESQTWGLAFWYFTRWRFVIAACGPEE